VFVLWLRGIRTTNLTVFWNLELTDSPGHEKSPKASKAGPWYEIGTKIFLSSDANGEIPKGAPQDQRTHSTVAARQLPSRMAGLGQYKSKHRVERAAPLAPFRLEAGFPEPRTSAARVCACF
jgi:hypothetical protein